jgi:hypothetical protein
MRPLETPSTLQSEIGRLTFRDAVDEKGYFGKDAVGTQGE